MSRASHAPSVRVLVMAGYATGKYRKVHLFRTTVPASSVLYQLNYQATFCLVELDNYYSDIVGAFQLNYRAKSTVSLQKALSSLIRALPVELSSKVNCVFLVVFSSTLCQLNYQAKLATQASSELCPLSQLCLRGRFLFDPWQCSVN